jgi:hypothetical protein
MKTGVTNKLMHYTCSVNTQQSAVAAQNNLSHSILLSNTKILAIKSLGMDQIKRKKVEIELYPNIINWKDGFCISRCWKPLIQTLKGK